jgi:hypothetical protein
VNSRAYLSRTAAIVVALPLTAMRFAVPRARSIHRRIRPVRSVVDIKGLHRGAAAAELIQPVCEGE